MDKKDNNTNNVPHLWRLFVAVDVPQVAKIEIARLEKELKKLNLFEGKYVNPDVVHVTLKFIGYVEQNALTPLKQLLKTVYFKPFNVTLGNLGFFGNRGAVHIVWMNLIASQMKELAQNVQRTLSQMIPPDPRPFQNHVTLARVKSTVRPNALQEAIKNMSVQPVSWTVNEFGLKRSVLTPEGPIYTDIDMYRAQ